jgi:2-iminobutanoate/2-iminopropanoate deaminase
MQKEIIYTKNAPEPVGPYSQAVKVNGFMYCSGMIPINPATGEVLKGSVSEQAELCLSNIKALLESTDLDLSHVVKTMIYLTDMSKFAEFNEVYSKYFNEGKPARSCVAVSELPKGVNVEVEVIAVLKKN